MQSRKRRGGGRSFLWAAHYCAALATYPEVVTRRASTSPPVLLFHARCMDRENRRAPPLFGLAPCGVFPATAIAGGAVRSYRTFSPLPRLRGAVCFLWHFPSTPLERRRPDVIRHTALWSSDFPLPACATWSARIAGSAKRNDQCSQAGSDRPAQQLNTCNYRWFLRPLVANAKPRCWRFGEERNRIYVTPFSGARPELVLCRYSFPLRLHFS